MPRLVKICSHSPVKVTSPAQWKILELYEKPQTNKHNLSRKQKFSEKNEISMFGPFLIKFNRKIFKYRFGEKRYFRGISSFVSVFWISHYSFDWQWYSVKFSWTGSNTIDKKPKQSAIVPIFSVFLIPVFQFNIKYLYIMYVLKKCWCILFYAKCNMSANRAKSTSIESFHRRNPRLITIHSTLHQPWGSFKHQLRLICTASFYCTIKSY